MERKLKTGYVYEKLVAMGRQQLSVICGTDGRAWFAHEAPDEVYEPEITPPERVPEGHEWTGELRPPGGDPYIQRKSLSAEPEWGKLGQGDVSWADGGYYEDFCKGPRYILRKLPAIPAVPDGAWQTSDYELADLYCVPIRGEHEGWIDPLHGLLCTWENGSVASAWTDGGRRHILRRKPKPEPKVEPKPEFKVGEYVVSRFVKVPLRITALGPHFEYDAKLEYPNGDPCYLHQAECSPWQPQVGDRVWVDGDDNMQHYRRGFANLDSTNLCHPVECDRYHTRYEEDGIATWRALNTIRPASFAPKPEPDPDEELMKDALVYFNDHAGESMTKIMAGFHKQKLARANADSKD